MAAKPRDDGAPAQRVRRSAHAGARALTAAALVAAADGTVVAAERSIDKQIIVPAPFESVCQAWTTRASIRTFFAPDAEVDARVGGAFRIYINPLAEPGMKGADDMRFMALQRPTMLSFDWNAPPSLPQVRTRRTFVVVRLAPVDANATHVRVPRPRPAHRRRASRDQASTRSIRKFAPGYWPSTSTR